MGLSPQLRTSVLIAFFVFSGSFAVKGSAQVEIDRTLQIVSGQAITTGDVRRTKLLKLVPGAATDAAVQTALENRLLMLLDIGSRQPAPSDADRDAARRAWEAALGPGPSLPERLAQAGTTDAAINAWFADEVRIQKYQTQRFSGAADVAVAIDNWVQTLRRRAGLHVRR
jgi:hypothetical protein